jgi:hypothetical protein
MRYLKLHHEQKIVQMFFFDKLSILEINRSLNSKFGQNQIAQFIAKSCATHDTENIIIPSLINYL